MTDLSQISSLTVGYVIQGLEHVPLFRNLIPRYLFVVVTEVFDVQTMRWWFRWWSNDPNGWNQEPKLPEPEDVFLLVRSKGSNQMTTSGAPSAAPSCRGLEIYRRWMGWDDPHEGYQIDGFVFESGANTRNLLLEICRDSPVDFGIHPIWPTFRMSGALRSDVFKVFGKYSLAGSLGGGADGQDIWKQKASIPMGQRVQNSWPKLEWTEIRKVTNSVAPW